MFKKGASLKKIWSRTKSKKKQQSKSSPSEQSVEGPQFQEVLYFVPNKKQEDYETKVREIRDELETSFSDQLDGIRKREASTTQRLNAKITAITKQRDEMKDKLLSTEKKYKNLKKKVLDETAESLETSDGCLKRENSKAGQTIGITEEEKGLVLNFHSKCKISSEESSASSNESQPKKTRAVDEHARSEKVTLQRRDWRSESSPEDEDVAGKEMDKASMQGWMRDTNRTMQDMQRCMTEIKTEVVGMSEKFEKILKTHLSEKMEDSHETKQDSKTRLEKQKQEQNSTSFTEKRLEERQAELKLNSEFPDTLQNRNCYELIQHERVGPNLSVTDTIQSSLEFDMKIEDNCGTINVDKVSLDSSKSAVAQHEATNTALHELVHDLARQVEYTLGKFLDSLLNEFCGTQNDKDQNTGGSDGKIEDICEHEEFQGDTKENATISQLGEHEFAIMSATERESLSLSCLSKPESVYQLHESSSCNKKPLPSTTVNEVNTFLNNCKCACHLNDHRNHDTTKSSGYASEDASSGYIGSYLRWDKGYVQDCFPAACPKVGAWGLKGNDYVQRHIVTSSPIIATLRDLRSDEI